MTSNRHLSPCFACLLSLFLLLSGCGVETVLLATGTAAGVMISDPRGPDGMLQDQLIAHKIHAKWQNALDKRLAKSHVYAVSLNRQVVLLGQVRDAAVRTRVAVLARHVPKVKQVFNYTTIGPASTLSRRSRDAWITTQVKSHLLSNLPKQVLKIKVVTEAGSVFLFGLLPASHAQRAAHIASRVPGVVRVVKIFEYS